MEKTDRDAEGQEENEIIPDCDMLDRGAEGAICQPLDLQKKGAVLMVTYSDLFAFVTMVCALITLVVTIVTRKK